jgi:predicted ATP-dependent protease
MAELCAILSALSGVPLRQGIAITGSVNQHGEAQAIGGVNEKIEGFFDVCNADGLTGDQGVIIPRSNAPHLMVRDDVAEAVARGQFHVWTVDNVDQAIELLTGVEAGAADGEGRFPEGTVNHLAAGELQAFADAARQFMQGERRGGTG